MVNIASAAADMWADLENAPLLERVDERSSRYGVEHDHLVSGIDLSPLGEDEIAFVSVIDGSQS